MRWAVETFDSVPSTQDLLKAKAEDGAAEGVVVQALEQTAGRGRRGNVWHSPRGNLYLSLLLRPDCAALAAGQLAFVLAVAAAQALESYTESGSVSLKWPNDILYNNLKLSGILLETNLNDGHVDWVVCGLGVNVSAPPEGAVGLGGGVDLAVLRDRLLEAVAAVYRDWHQKGFASIRERWLKQAHGLHGPVAARMVQETVCGVFEGLDDDGALLLSVGGTPRVVSAAEIHFGTE